MSMPGNFFLITRDEGGLGIDQLSEEALMDRIALDENGECYYGAPLEFADSTKRIMVGHWKGESVAIVIRGEIVVPRAVEVVTKWTLD